MKTCMNRLLIITLCLALCVCAWPSAANAFNPVDLTHPVSLTIFANDEDVPLKGVGFELYRIAAMNDYAQFELLPAYAGFSGDINRLETAGDWILAAHEFQQLAAGISPDEAVTSGADGLAVLNDIPSGLYLITGLPVMIGEWAYSFTPFILSIPTRDVNDNWVYDVYSDVKLEKTPAFVDIDVVKVWDDIGHESDRPNLIYVDLLRDGMPIAVAMLHAGNSWSHTFPHLPAAHQYSVKERDIPRWYEVSYETINGVLVIRNTHSSDKTPEPPIPSTGQLWWPVPILAGAGMLLCITGWFIHRKWSQEHE